MKVKIDIVSGFLGAGKTTLIKKLLKEKLDSEKIAIIENEFGEIGIDGTLLKRAGLEIKEINSGCICCSLAGDFGESVREIIDKFSPQRIIVEPSGVAKLSELIRACRENNLRDLVEVNMIVTIVDVLKFDLYLNNFGEFFEDQIKNAKVILLSRTDVVDEEKISSVIRSIRNLNFKYDIVTTPWA